LAFYNLRQTGKSQSNVGDDERKEIWIPNLIFENSVKEKRVKSDEFSTLTVLQNGTGFIETNEYLQENVKFEGSENFLIYTRTYLIDLSCEFEQHSYPFDSQTCSIQVIIFNKYMSLSLI
jgi:hypothetical protein